MDLAGRSATARARGSANGLAAQGAAQVDAVQSPAPRLSSQSVQPLSGTPATPIADGQVPALAVLQPKHSVAQRRNVSRRRASMSARLQGNP